MLNKRMLKDMPPDTIFATGVGIYPGLYKYGIKWIAKRGRVDDWAIYYLKEDCSMEYISREGDKCFTHSIIKKLVPYEESAFKRYRF